jgi:ankyrin repeat protein
MQELSDWTPLGLAVLARDAAGVSALLEGGANPNERFLDAKRKGRGFFPLEYAVYLDAGPVVEALLRGGASRDLAIECGKGAQHTPLSLAEAKGKKAALAALQPPPPVQEAPKKEEAAKPAAKSPMLSQRGALTSQRLAAPAPSTMTSQTSPGALRSAARPGPAGSTDAPKKSPRIVSTKNASAVVNYGDLVLGEEIGKGAYGKVRCLDSFFYFLIVLGRW